MLAAPSLWSLVTTLRDDVVVSQVAGWHCWVGMLPDHPRAPGWTRFSDKHFWDRNTGSVIHVACSRYSNGVALQTQLKKATHLVLVQNGILHVASEFYFRGMSRRSAATSDCFQIGIIHCKNRHFPGTF